METPKNLSFIYENIKEAISFPCNGAYGGSAPDGSGVVVHFFLEYTSIPHSTLVPIQENNTIDQTKGQNVSRGDITREIQARTILTPETAIVIGDWLKKNGLAILENRKNLGDK